MSETEKEFNKQVGKDIKILRELKGLTQKELAYMVGFKNGISIYNVERGKTGLSFHKAVEICIALGVKPNYLSNWQNR